MLADRMQLDKHSADKYRRFSYKNNSDSIYDSRDQLEMLHERGCVTIDKAEKIFVIKFDEIDKFLVASNTIEKRSKLLCCNGVVCYLKLSKCAREESPERDLSVKVTAIIGSEISSIDAYFDIKLCDQSPSKYAVIQGSATKTFTRSKFCYGWDRFVPVHQLNDSAFIKENTIKLQLHLKVLAIERAEY